VVVLQSPLNVVDTVYSKTTIMKRVLGEDHHEICPTVGFNIKTLEYKGLNLNLWDVGGQKSIRTYWRNYFEQTDGIIWVVDSVDRWRLEECKMHLKDLLTQEVSAHVCFVLWQGTKCQRYLPLYFAFVV
jgi:small GTP-binding protein